MSRTSLERFPRLMRLLRAAGQFLDVGAVLVRRPRVLLSVLLCSVVYTAVGSFSLFCFLKAVNVKVSPVDVLVVGAAIQLVTLLPITIGGLGLREGASVVLLGAIGVPREAALASALLLRVGAMLLAALSLPWAWQAVRDLRKHPRQ